MSWHEAWDADTVYIGARNIVDNLDLPSVKHLISDLCNAIQERNKYRFDSQIAWNLADMTVANDVTPDDFKGAIVNSNPAETEYFSVSELCNDIVNNLKALFVGHSTTTREGFYTDDTFTTALTFADAVSNVGLLSQEAIEEVDEFSNIKNWRSLLWWKTLKGVVQQLRYLELRGKYENGDLTVELCGYADVGTDPSRNLTRQGLWDNVVFSDTGSAAGGVGYKAIGTYIYDKFDGTNEEWEWEGSFADPSDLSLKYLYEKRPTREFSWDSDYKRYGSSWVSRSFPVPKSAHNGKIPVRLDPFFALWWASQTNMVATPDHESTEPDTTDFSVDVSVLGEDASVTYDSWLNGTFLPAGDWVVCTASPDGTDTIECNLPATAPGVICADGYIPDGYDATPPVTAGRVYFGAELVNGHFGDACTITASVGRLNAQFDIASVTSYA